MVSAADVTAGLPGGADTRASTPGLASSPVARCTAASARALAELGALNGFLALSKPMAVAPNTPATTNATRASSAIRRGWRIARFASAPSTSADPAGRQRPRRGRAYEHEPGQEQPGADSLEEFPAVAGALPVGRRVLRVPAPGRQVDRDVDDDGECHRGGDSAAADQDNGPALPPFTAVVIASTTHRSSRSA